MIDNIADIKDELTELQTDLNTIIDIVGEDKIAYEARAMNQRIRTIRILVEDIETFI